RDVAHNTGQDRAVVFVYDPAVGRTQIIPAIKVGTVREPTTAPDGPGGGGGAQASARGDQPYFDRDVFVPAAAGEVMTLPAYWMVRGYAAPGMLLDQDSVGSDAATWYNSQIYDGNNTGSNIKQEAHWVFPETGFFPADAQVNGGGLDGGFDNVDRDLPTARQSFMIRFDARTGAVSRDTSAALFVDPRNSSEREYGNQPTPHQQSLRIDLAEDLEVWASGVLNSTDLNNNLNAFGNDDLELREQLIGTASNDTILVKPVSRVALYDERRLALGIGARGLNSLTQTLYLPHEQDEQDVEIRFDMDLFANNPDVNTEEEVLERINQWINGDTNFDDQLDFDDEPESRLYLIQSYTGELKEVLR
ncbi:MAG: hypothetical protein WD114_07140, partial [Phycisphaerales bacterium]